MLFHRSKIAGRIVALDLLEEDVGDFKSFLSTMDAELPLIKGPAPDGYYARMRDQFLPGGEKYAMVRLDRPQHYYSKREERYLKTKTGNTFVSLNDDDSISFIFHETEIVKIAPDNTTTIDFGGWYTKETVIRMNKLMPPGFSFYRKFSQGGGTETDQKAFWDVEGAQHLPKHKLIIPASDGDKILPDGTLQLMEPYTYKRVRPRKEPSIDEPPIA